jgi:pullulanase/glycogen debranching enzyme
LAALRGCNSSILRAPKAGKSLVEWLDFDWRPMTDERWNERTNRRLIMVVSEPGAARIAVLINGDRRAVVVMPVASAWNGLVGRKRIGCSTCKSVWRDGGFRVAGRSVLMLTEQPAEMRRA